MKAALVFVLIAASSLGLLGEAKRNVKPKSSKRSTSSDNSAPKKPDEKKVTPGPAIAPVERQRLGPEKGASTTIAADTTTAPAVNATKTPVPFPGSVTAPNTLIPNQGSAGTEREIFDLVIGGAPEDEILNAVKRGGIELSPLLQRMMVVKGYGDLVDKLTGASSGSGSRLRSATDHRHP